MNNFSYCTNVLCPKADNCERTPLTISEESEWYSFFEYEITLNGAECDHYMPRFKTETITAGGVDK
jgi:hypothetical protein